MLTNFMSSTTAEERKAMIIQYTLVRNDSFKTEEFLQNIYELLLDDGTYIRMEFKRALGKRNIFDPEASTLIDSYLSKATDTFTEKVITARRTYKMYRSRRGKSYSWNIVRRYK